MQNFHRIQRFGIFFLHQIHLAKASLANQSQNDKTVGANFFNILLFLRGGMSSVEARIAVFVIQGRVCNVMAWGLKTIA